MRTADITRKTAETDITLALNIDGKGVCDIHSGNGFFDHMLTLLCRHGRLDCTLCCNGDTQVDFHHSAEDIGIALGTAFAQALGDKKGVTRYAHTILPMDEALVLSAVDLSGRGHLSCDLPLPSARVGDFDTELCREFFEAFAQNAKLTLHINGIAGVNTHHIIEAAFKSVARSLRAACAIDSAAADEIPSTKGTL